MANQRPEIDIQRTAFALRGYNVTNLGKTGEFVDHPLYGEIIQRYLETASKICRHLTGLPTDLIQRVRANQETDLETYAEAVALIVAVEQAQIEILRTFFDLDYAEANFAFGFSLGEISALIGSGMISLEDGLTVPILMASDCASLAKGVVLAIAFTKQQEINLPLIKKLCLEINREGHGVIGISSLLSPNTVLLMGQQDTIDRFKHKVREADNSKILIRKNDQLWPPLHTPIMWQKNIPCRTAELMHRITVNEEFHPRIFSLVTGQADYDALTAREILHRWTYLPQRLWDAVCYTLASDVDTVIHVGPDPNIVPATFQRLSDNVLAQIQQDMRMKAISGMIHRRWISRMLPKRATLLRAPAIRHIVLEDWLLENASKVAVAAPALI